MADLGNPVYGVGLRDAGSAPDRVSCWIARALLRTERVLRAGIFIYVFIY